MLFRRVQYFRSSITPTGCVARGSCVALKRVRSLFTVECVIGCRFAYLRGSAQPILSVGQLMLLITLRLHFPSSSGTLARNPRAKLWARGPQFSGAADYWPSRSLHFDGGGAAMALSAGTLVGPKTSSAPSRRRSPKPGHVDWIRPNSAGG